MHQGILELFGTNGWGDGIFVILTFCLGQKWQYDLMPF
jgi:hypothetical protein